MPLKTRFISFNLVNSFFMVTCLQSFLLETAQWTQSLIRRLEKSLTCALFKYSGVFLTKKVFKKIAQELRKRKHNFFLFKTNKYSEKNAQERRKRTHILYH